MSEIPALFSKVILPLKIRGDIYYIVPEHLAGDIKKGSRVIVNFANREYSAVISDLCVSTGGFKGSLKEILSVLPSHPVQSGELEFWHWISEYYMCTIGEVYKAAYPNNSSPEKQARTKKEIVYTDKENVLPSLSKEQNEAFTLINEAFANKKVALLNGVTGSGKTEIYIHLASEQIKRGMSVLYMVPEIALSRQLSTRLAKIFGNRLLIYHSRESTGERKRVHNFISKGEEPYIILGLRSSLFLPFRNLGLIIVDEEHDASYKQTDPAPRYNARDSAIMLAGIHQARILLGSATPSLESLFNAFSNRYSLIELKGKFFGAIPPVIEIIDTIRESKRGRMEGVFSTAMLKSIEDTIAAGEQVLIFRNRRSYSPIVQCLYCGDIPKCPHCNVSLSYHKSREELRCHYCDHHVRFSTICSKCGKPGLKDRGTGTEKIEELVKLRFPLARIDRFDFETTRSKLRENRILKDFAQHKLDILVGTQMISKGFDFENLSLICLLQADSMLAIQDFRANERALQLLTQLSGRAGRKYKQGKIIIQTAQAEHPVYKSFVGEQETISDLLDERKEFDYPPFVRLIKITLSCTDRNKLKLAASKLADLLADWGVKEFSGPFSPLIDRLRGEYMLQFWLKLPKDNTAPAIKKIITQGIDKLIIKEYSSVKISLDADPL
ncbi:MAG: primosomal protein N' [Bacteroidetes bacterium GWF2_40_14]|nr:MAG: primosomal protein N' [Bacteroidetes bacterium GWF2_40_14]